MFHGKATAMPCAELKQRFPNLYMEPMQMNNSDNKSYNTIPYMLINLGNIDTIYTGRDTPVADIKSADAGCEYLEVNEIIEDVRGINWQPPHACKMVTSDLVYSPAQVTEHRCIELNDQNISEDTKWRFKELKEQYPRDWNKNTKGSYQKKDGQQRIQGQGCLSYSNKRCKVPLPCRIQWKHIHLHMQNGPSAEISMPEVHHADSQTGGNI